MEGEEQFDGPGAGFFGGFGMWDFSLSVFQTLVTGHCPWQTGGLCT